MRMIYDEKLAQAAYLIGCQRTNEAVLIDPLRDVDRYLALAKENGLRIVAVAETHIHADFVSGARELAERGATVYVSDEGPPEWKTLWLDKKVGGGTYAHRLLHDGERFSVGMIEFTVMHTPGHTPEHIAFLVTDRGGGADAPMGIASGDFVFVGDLGRPDLLETAAGAVGMMEPSARLLYHTVGKLAQLPDYVQVWPAHGAGSACGKALGAVPTSTIGYEKRFNSAIRAARSEQEFVDFILADQPEPPLYFANMKHVNKVGPAVLGGVPQPRRLLADELLQLDGRRVALIDTRAWDEFRAGHVSGSLWFPLNRSFNTDAGSMIRPEEPIYLILQPAQVDEAVRDLIRVGLDHVSGWFAVQDMDALRASGQLAALPELDVAQAEQRLARADVHVLDVRRATEFVEGHLPQAVNIAHTRLASRLDDVPRGKPLLVNCRSGVRSGRSAAFLQRAGYDVINLRGGMLAWDKAHSAAADSKGACAR